MDKILAAMAKVLGALIVLVGFSLLFSLPIMWTWNYVMPSIFDLPSISWGQAWCLNFLAGSLIKASHSK